MGLFNLKMSTTSKSGYGLIGYGKPIEKSFKMREDEVSNNLLKNLTALKVAATKVF